MDPDNVQTLLATALVVLTERLGGAPLTIPLSELEAADGQYSVVQDDEGAIRITHHTPDISEMH